MSSSKKSAFCKEEEDEGIRKLAEMMLRMEEKLTQQMTELGAKVDRVAEKVEKLESGALPKLGAAKEPKPGAGNAVSALNEKMQSLGLSTPIYNVVSTSGPSHNPRFEMAAVVNGRQYPSVMATSKADGKREAAEAALRVMANEAVNAPDAGVSKVHPPNPAADKIAAAVVDKLLGLNGRSFPGKKVVAGFVLEHAGDFSVVSLATGNRCVTGSALSLEGRTVNDCHAEVLARRGLIRYFHNQIWNHVNGEESVLEMDADGRLKLKEEYSLHLYISTAPCGDGALFSPRDEGAGSRSGGTWIPGEEHSPTNSSAVQGLLRTKMEGGEGTIPTEKGDGESESLLLQTWDGLLRGERLRTMSCSDKLAKWNMLGLQGSLLTHFLHPVYMSSLTLGFLFDPGHLSRAVCCRFGPEDEGFPAGFRLNHPDLGRVTACEAQREVEKTTERALTWSSGDCGPEVVDGTTGQLLDSSVSRLCKRNLLLLFSKTAVRVGKPQLVGTSYRETKMAAAEYQTVKSEFLKIVSKRRLGCWVSKPLEMGMFELTDAEISDDAVATTDTKPKTLPPPPQLAEPAPSVAPEAAEPAVSEDQILEILKLGGGLSLRLSDIQRRLRIPARQFIPVLESLKVQGLAKKIGDSPPTWCYCGPTDVKTEPE